MNKKRKAELIKQINSYLPSIQFLISLLDEIHETEYTKKLTKIYNKLCDKYRYADKDERVVFDEPDEEAEQLLADYEDNIIY